MPSATVDSALTDAVDAGGEASFFVVLKDRADLSGVKKQKTHAAKARAAYERLRAHADATQRSLTVLRENARGAGRLHEAVRIGTRAPALADQPRDPVAAVFERASLAELRLLLEEPEPARALAAQAVAGAEAYDAWCLPHALATTARVRGSLGDPAQAAGPHSPGHDADPAGSTDGGHPGTDLGEVLDRVPAVPGGNTPGGLGQKPAGRTRPGLTTRPTTAAGRL
ncbi:hypothetical protein [Streptomyces zaomyceticus]|uniref:hypothetical protein n=1 Tax=Streptomyces zaomyceticus TaxID=68286 RepID=UPI003430F464